MSLIHATTVAIDGQGVVIMGASGSGKSSLALQLISLGAVLVADDQTQLTSQEGRLTATCPDAIQGLIEARGVGLIRVPHAGPTKVSLVVDLDQAEAKRLPDPHQHTLQGTTLPCLHNADTPHFPSAIMLYVRAMTGN